MQYTLVRSSRRTLAIQIHPERGVLIRAPRLVSERRIEKFLKEKEAWVKKHIAKIEKRKTQTDSPTTPKFLGKPLAQPTLKSFTTKKQLESWYKAQALPHLTKRTEHFTKLLAQNYKPLIPRKAPTPTAIHIRAYKSRWGTCHANNSITYNWRIIMAPPSIVDYLVAHEVTHFIHKNHQKRFHALLAKILPDYKKHRKWLRDNGHALTL
jgi:predicted metal-dependent hydrolase